MVQDGNNAPSPDQLGPLAAAVQRAGRASEPTTVEQDLACQVCGYNLRMLQDGGRCPECGVPVQRSLRGATLTYCPPRHVAGLQLGMISVVSAWMRTVEVLRVAHKWARYNQAYIQLQQ